jgi:ABC-type transport system involved in cytochrome bd biosynthesis fused ATPase/permease subunit
VRESVAQAALLQVSALGLGTIVAALASTTVADVTGILAAGVLSLIGLFLLPARREKARRELAAKVTAVREKLMASLTATFEAERDRAAARVREAVSAYAAFVRRENERLDQAQASLARLGADLDALAARLDAIG